MEKRKRSENRGVNDARCSVWQQAICHDLDSPVLLRQASGAGIELVVGPSADWLLIASLHADMATLRALVLPTDRPARCCEPADTGPGSNPSVS